MIEIGSVVKAFGSGNSRFLALDNVDVTIRENEFFTLLGPSGCGKTTLLRIIAGFEHPTSGSVTMKGRDLLSDPPHRRPVNTVFQSYALFPHLTVAQNIGFGLEMLGTPKDVIRRTVDEMMALVKMTEMADRQTSQISGGQQQRVALARALAPRPQVLLLDEPLSALDFKLRKDMQLELKRLQMETGITFIFVTHDQEEALTMSDRIAVMNKGSIRQIGGPRDIYDHPAERFVADFIGDTNFIAGEVLKAGGGMADVKLGSGKTVQARAPESGQPKGKVTLAVRPEHATVTGENDGLLPGTMTEIVYFGTGTNYHVRLDDGSDFIVRVQNQPNMNGGFSNGDRVAVDFAAGVGQILKD
ncbi:MAG: ABC transporter ATP-binding protein [Sulfitobacter sp.]